MKKKVIIALCLLVAVLCLAACNGTAKTEKMDAFSVGYAKADITPKVEWELGLVGTNNEKERILTEALTPLYATCAAISDTEGTTVLLFGTDLLHTATEITMAIREQITEKTGIEGKYVQFTASHNHSGPGQVAGYGFENTYLYNEYFIEQCVNAALEALEDRKPATMYCAYDRPEGLNFKRYYMLKDGRAVGRSDGSYTQADLYAHTEAADNLLQIIKFEREGAKSVALVNWQAHYKGLGADYKTMCHSDYPGYIRKVLEEQASCETVFLLGASGDMASSSEISAERTPANESPEVIGTTLAQTAMKALEGAQPAETGKIHLEENIFHIDTNGLTYYLYTFGFGDVGFVMAPYEMYQSNGMDIRTDSPYKMTMIGTLANASDNNFYLPNDAAYDIFNAYGLSNKYKKGDAGKFHEQYINMLNICFENSGSTQKEKGEGYIMDHSPKSDGVTYQNPNKEQEIVKVGYGMCQVMLVKNSQLKTLLAINEDVAKQVVEKDNVQLLFDERNIITGIVE